MESKSKLIRHAFDTYRIAPFSSWLLGITTGILIAAICALELVVPFSLLFSFPLLILPIIFSSTVQHVLFKGKGKLTVLSSLRSFGFYFTPSFRSSFRFFISLLKGFIVFLATEMIISFVASSILQVTNSGFLDSLNSLYEYLYSENATIDGLNEIILSNDGILFKYICISFLPAIYLAFTFMIYNNSRYSIMIYYQMQFRQVHPRFTKYVYMESLRKKRFAMLGDYLMLNWPLYVLLLIGFAGGSYLGYMWEKDFFTMLACGAISGAVLSTFFLPFYFGNQEAFYDKYASLFNDSTKSVTQFMLASIQRNIELSTEEKERLEQSLVDNRVITDEDESKKKDPDGSE